MTISFLTLGCKANQFDTQAMESILISHGHTISDFESECDAYVINTCSVTGVSDKKSRQAIRQAKRRSPNAIIGVCGCFSQMHPDSPVLAQADVVCGSTDREAFIELLENALAERKKHMEIKKARREFEYLPAGGLEGRTRAMLKVQDGCDNYCTYCIIPYSRGHIRSMSPEYAVSEIKRLQDIGYREVIITGIEISSYGRDLDPAVSLISLLEQLCDAAPNVRLRLGSLEPRTIDEEFCKRASKLNNLCPHFHLSLQSGCDSVLSRMKRKYDTERYYKSVTLLREYFDDPALTTDLITGFPGETDEEFKETLAFIEKCGFAAMHIFPYSIREGTPAAKMSPQIEKSVKEARAKEASAIALKMKYIYMDRQIGKNMHVLFEDKTGHSENYLEVHDASKKHLPGELCDMKITGRTDEKLIGIEA